MEERGYIAPLNDKVGREHVTFRNRYGIALAGDLYTAKDIEPGKRYPALIVGAPYGGVKEQGPCVYAGELAQQGFIVLTFDAPFMGESEGNPRHTSGPEMFSESFSAAVDWLGLQETVDRERIGAIGICGSGAFALSAAAMDTRIKAVATASLFDMAVASRLGMDEQTVRETKEQLSRQRWTDAENGEPEWIPSYPEAPTDTVPEGLQGIGREFYEFYGMARGFHPRARAGFTATSTLSFMNYRLLDYLREIAPRPILLIAGEKAESRFMSDMVYERAAEPKEYIVVPGANHIDLYDGGGRDDRGKIPFDRLESFFKANL
ncbi:MAG: alpha/beta hydrolase [Alistipes sp.]|uniref:alpha/beta hydrolase n=1 Tax=Alistipes sp. TaxID=1872444 RepID=UPI001E065FDC|nr:alpha/beta hydrolase [Alistipes sp.]MBS5019769.1 alpha/beta hydrolase [Alistipes sp.]